MAAEPGHEPNRIYTDQNGDLHLNGAKFFNDAEADLAPSLEALGDVSLAELQLLDGLTAGTVTASKAVVVDTNKDIGDFRNLDAVNLDAGASGTAGSVDVFPTTASKGKLAITCTDQTGNTTVTVNANAMGQATTVNLPDPGAAASYLLQSTAQVTLAEADVLDGATVGAAVASKALVAGSGRLIPTGLVENIASSAIDFAVAAADSDKIYLITAADKTVTLPSTVSGLRYTFIVTAAALSVSTGFSISPAAADKIMGGGIATSADNKDLINTGATDAEGDSITVIGDGADGWYVIAKNGIWAREG